MDGLPSIKLTGLSVYDRHYIAAARSKRPVVPRAVSDYVVNHYVRLRQVQKIQEDQKKTHTYTSARTLLGVLRLAQALARLRFADEVDESDINEALRLMAKSKESLQDDADDEDREPDQSAASKIFAIIKAMGKGQRGRGRRIGRGPGRERDMDMDEDEEDQPDLSIVDIRARVLAKGYTEDALAATLKEVRAAMPCSVSV